jgi:hypothetical protein
MTDYDWCDRFMHLFQRCLEQFQKGNYNYNSYYTLEDLNFLRSIGYKPREFFDFIEDHGPDLSANTAMLVAAQRRSYFLEVQGGKASKHEIKSGDLPSRDAALGGIPWLPRILVKAKAKLKGELDPDIMYGCGGDRMFLQKHDIAPADFLDAVCRAGDDDNAVLVFVKR